MSSFSGGGSGFGVGKSFKEGGEDSIDETKIVPLTEQQKQAISTSDRGTKTIVGSSMIAVASIVIASPTTLVSFSPSLFIFLNN